MSATGGSAMRAMVITSPGGPEVLGLRERPRPVPRADQVVVRVRATGVNRADLLQRAGKYPAPPGAPEDIPGLEFAGEVADVGEAVQGWRTGDRVFGISGGGTYAEFVAVHAGSLAAIPPTLDWAAAAAVPEAFITAHDALVTQGGLARGESVLVHAVGSGVGLAAVQVARWRGATAYGTTRTPAKLEAARALGMTDGVAVEELPAVVEAVRGWTGGRGLSVVLDLVGGPYVPIGIEALAPLGRLMLVGTVAGTRAELRLDRILGKRLTVRGTVLRARSDDEKAAATAAFVRDLLPAFTAGELRPVVDRVLPLEVAAEAHRLIAADANTGKVVLLVP